MDQKMRAMDRSLLEKIKSDIELMDKSDGKQLIVLMHLRPNYTIKDLNQMIGQRL